MYVGHCEPDCSKLHTGVATPAVQLWRHSSAISQEGYFQPYTLVAVPWAAQPTTSSSAVAGTSAHRHPRTWISWLARCRCFKFSKFSWALRSSWQQLVVKFRWRAPLRLLKRALIAEQIDDIVELRRYHHVDVLCVTETWHDADSTVLGRLRSAGLDVVDRPRPRVAEVSDLTVNHDGVTVISTASVLQSPVSIDEVPTTFELLCVRAVA